MKWIEQPAGGKLGALLRNPNEDVNGEIICIPQRMAQSKVD